MAVLSCLALSAACADDAPQGDLSGNTEVNLVISDPATASEQLLVLIDFVSYRITCPDSGLTPYDDSIDLAGNFEVDANANPPVWELVTSLPLADPLFPCVISLWVFYEDEVICSGSQLLAIYEDSNPLTPNKADVVLECSLSVNPPSGDAAFDGSFDFVHGNYCPQVFWLGWYPSPDPLVLNIQTRSLDVDGTCGENCDPQTCDFTTNPPTCSHAPDPFAVTSTLSAPAGNGTFGDDLALDTTYACDPLLPGPTEICVLVSDGDDDCNRMSRPVRGRRLRRRRSGRQADRVHQGPLRPTHGAVQQRSRARGHCMRQLWKHLQRRWHVQRPGFHSGLCRR
jgi:hypothetical protein